jgi:hypothetical protein
MSKVIGRVSGKELKLFNMCRLWLRVMWMSDITDADGRYVTWAATKGIRDQTRTIQWKWPVQGEPPKEAWTVWDQVVRSLGDRQRNGKIKLVQSLGHWNEGQGEWFYDQRSERLLNTTTGAIYTRKVGRPTQNASMQFCRSHIVDDTFLRSSIVSVICRGTIEEVEVESIAEINSTQHTTYESFEHFVTNNPQWNWWSAELNYNEDDIFYIAKDIQEGNRIAVSDGSYKDQHGTAAIVIEGVKSGRRITSCVVVTGKGSVQCAFRSEASGILAAIQMVNAITQHYGITTGKCKMGCDGLSALQRCFYKGTTAVDIPHYDVIQAARVSLSQSTIEWQRLYIPGHQTIYPLDREATLNDQMDNQCKHYWAITDNARQRPFYEPWSVWIGSDKVTSNLTKEIQQHCSILRADRYWKSKAGAANETIDWESTGRAMRTMPRQRRQWITKHSSGFCAVGRMAKRTRDSGTRMAMSTLRC